MNKYKKIKKQKKLAKRIIKNADRSECCDTQLKTSKLGRVMCTSCNKFCKVIPGKQTINPKHYIPILIWITILVALVIAACIHSRV